jgi:hypothetical protein
LLCPYCDLGAPSVDDIGSRMRKLRRQSGCYEK